MKEQSPPPVCCIRGEIHFIHEAEQTEFHRMTHECPYRVLGKSEMFNWQNQYFCSHPGAASEHQLLNPTPQVDVEGGSLEGYATFCAPVDYHRTEVLAKKSVLIYDGSAVDVTPDRLLSSGDE